MVQRCVEFVCIPLNDVQTRLRLNDLRHLTRLQCKRGLFELGLHVTFAKESPTQCVSLRPQLVRRLLYRMFRVTAHEQ